MEISDGDIHAVLMQIDDLKHLIGLWRGKSVPSNSPCKQVRLICLHVANSSRPCI